ncbi:hypothetical protein BV25DRAFT_1578422 [Artomyces pyxidatus]|uniref:Uncharacterized protein n=1 Tax=Artomyces pyxidatus TaxID=48021 RepID=A0ACB8SKR8_9AGAM|nr:hypothetical protein BV25DRAFT_1578422 [Artomyces pyxidatus]
MYAHSCFARNRGIALGREVEHASTALRRLISFDLGGPHLHERLLARRRPKPCLIPTSVCERSVEIIAEVLKTQHYWYDWRGCVADIGLTPQPQFLMRRGPAHSGVPLNSTERRRRWQVFYVAVTTLSETLSFANQVPDIQVGNDIISLRRYHRTTVMTCILVSLTA